jgi:pyruvate carboxylase
MPLAFPRSVVEMMQGYLGQPEGGWPKAFQEVVLRSSHAEPIVGRPGAAIPPADFSAAADEIQAKTRRDAGEDDVLSYLLYPQVYLDFQKHVLQFGDTSKIPTSQFFYGLQPGEETSIEIERGKTLFVKYLTTGEVREDGTRTVFFELNGQPRAVTVADRSVAGSVKRHPKADPENAAHIAAPMPGKVSAVAVRRGQSVKAGERLVSIEAMKMETAIYSPGDAVVGEIFVEPGTVVESRDLLLKLET